MEGIRVLDFGQYIAGPAAAAILGDLGAEVIRVDPPSGPRWTVPAARCFERGKKQVMLDLKDATDRAKAMELVEEADVLIENFRPGVMDRLGLGPEVCRQHNSLLVYLSLPGFASTDTERRNLRAWEAVIAAESGQFSDMGLSRVLMGIQPSFTPLTLASAYGALFGVVGVCSALYHRTRTGRGAHLEVPLGSALMEGLVFNSMHVGEYPERYKTLREQEIERRRAAGEPLDMGFEELQGLLDPFYRSYRCGDGRPIHVVNTSHRQHVHRMLEILGLLEDARSAGVPELSDWYLSTRQWPEGVDCALGLYPLPLRWVRWFTERLEQKFMEKSAFEWEQIFGEAGIPVVAHRTSAEWLNSEHGLASALVHEYEDESLGRVRQGGPAVWLESSAERAARFTAMQNVPAATAEFELSCIELVGDCDETGGWLSGVRILDMANVIAGPTVASTLARFGAEIIKVDPIRPNFDPWNTVVFGLQAGRGKRSVLLNAKSESGKGVLEKLIAWADLVTVNKVERQLVPLGLDAESLSRINPHAVMLRLDAFGGPQVGPKSDHVGYDDLAQAMTGVMARFGGSLEAPEEHAHLGTIDVLCGVAGAAGAAAALLQLERNARTDVARTSLAAVAQLIQAPYLIDHEGRGPWDEPSGRAACGETALYRLYQTSDDWLFLAATEDDLARLQTCMGTGNLPELTDAELESTLAERFRTKARDEWLAKLSAANIGVGAVRSLAELRSTYTGGSESGTYRFDSFPDHPAGRHVVIASACAIRTSDAPVTTPIVTEKYGTSTRAVLAEFGCTEAEIESMFAKGDAADSWSTDYLPD